MRRSEVKHSFAKKTVVNRAVVRQAVLSVVLMAAGAFAIHRLCVIPFRHDLIMRDIEQRMTALQTFDSYQAISLARMNLEDLDRVAHSRRLDPAWYMFYGANCEVLLRWEDAANAYSRGLEIDQRPELYFNRALVMLQLNRTDQAVADMVTAVRFNPFFIDQISGDLRTRVAAGAGLP